MWRLVAVNDQDIALRHAHLLSDGLRRTQLCQRVLILLGEGYSGVLVAEDGSAGLELFRRARPKLLVIELKLPVLAGIELLRRVRQEEPNADVIILTGAGNVNDVNACLALGALDLLRKPVNAGELLRSVARALPGRARPQRPPQTGIRTRTDWTDPSNAPDVVLPYFEHNAEGRGPDDQYARGAAIIRRWQALARSEPPDRSEFNRLVQLLESEESPSSGWYDLWRRIVAWGVVHHLTEWRSSPWGPLAQPKVVRLYAISGIASN